MSGSISPEFSGVWSDPTASCTPQPYRSCKIAARLLSDSFPISIWVCLIVPNSNPTSHQENFPPRLNAVSHSETVNTTASQKAINRRGMIQGSTRIAPDNKISTPLAPHPTRPNAQD